MNTYVVTKSNQDYDETIVGVYSTLEKAKNSIPVVWNSVEEAGELIMYSDGDGEDKDYSIYEFETQ